mmetsp:Transcript_12531/g.27019  ORF Transcript_12531/g.27019 Transcript_12531/m.27019 type:complete len:194 (+) Transcript_12531:213-794(+)|eukprot:CAMPEP_0202917024 /NCGR_PEP_ID=MMETSP1392-20130828/70051_1 /ASSEMBLY_ACC=CAM_ASM_000868 /TAXON_ID=225041 /ORGANISM="Chlamydomonas chlamydogama, Strain SAG 11-48b" /LENGTH=193 /DNA_ID=CAMNT_0049609631 /DNA_START=144 /DNA_END=725 /DNA_ORIENTATION=+
MSGTSHQPLPRYALYINRTHGAASHAAHLSMQDIYMYFRQYNPIGFTVTSSWQQEQLGVVFTSWEAMQEALVHAQNVPFHGQRLDVHLAPGLQQAKASEEADLVAQLEAGLSGLGRQNPDLRDQQMAQQLQAGLSCLGVPQQQQLSQQLQDSLSCLGMPQAQVREQQLLQQLQVGLSGLGAPPTGAAYDQMAE